MAKNTAIELLAEIAEKRDLDVEKLKLKKVPARTKAILTKWMRSAKVPEAALKKKILQASCGKKTPPFYVFSFQVSKPKAYSGKVIVQGNAILGESSNRVDAPASARSRPRPKPKSRTVSASALAPAPTPKLPPQAAA